MKRKLTSLLVTSCIASMAYSAVAVADVVDTVTIPLLDNLSN